VLLVFFVVVAPQGILGLFKKREAAAKPAVGKAAK
jgi:hypothetical protein